jgi:tetratricopeptide (TPR) repeat protein
MQPWLTLLFVCVALTRLSGAGKTDAVVNDGIAAYKAHDYDLAIAKFTAALREDAKDPIIYNDRGLAYKEKHEYARSIPDFTEALRFKQEWYLYYNRGTAYSESGDEKSALADYAAALKTVPRRSAGEIDCLVARAHAYFNLEQAEKAMADLNSAIKIGVKEADPYILRGILHKVHHEYSLSLADYEKAIALDPNNVRGYEAEAYLLSVCPAPKYRNGHKAVAYATKACELTDWKAADHLETLAAAYAENRQFDEATTWQKKAAELAPGEVDATRLALYEHKQPFRDLNRSEPAVPDLSGLADHVTIELGRKVSAQFAQKGDDLVEPKLTQGLHRQARTVLLNFKIEKKKYVLRLEHTFWRKMQGRCLARLAGYDTYFETDILPVPVGTTNPEIWSEPIEELVLFNLKLVGPSSEPTPPEDDDQGADVAAITGRAPLAPLD